ncbi:MAG: hypothetical protein V2J25_15035 [Desulfatiglans sp.]|jgi:hypothetical protein|nr:hypothetical protein [Desulfatiglans sp.]
MSENQDFFNDYGWEEEKRELRSQLTRQQRMLQEIQQEDAKKFTDGLIDRSVAEEMKQLGVDVSEFQQLVSENPERAQQHLRDSAKRYVQKVVQGRPRDKDGRFLPKGKQPVDTGTRHENLHEIASKSKGSDQDIKKMVAAIIPADDPFWSTRG